MKTVIQLENLSKAFGEDLVLKQVNREFEEGKIHGIVGNNGSGKTVMMKCICGFLQPTEGRVFVNFQQVGKDVDFPKDVGVIIETRVSSEPERSEKPGTFGFSPEKNPPGAWYAIRSAGSAWIRTAKAGGEVFSGHAAAAGNCQAIMEDPSILILDEPFNGLDKHGVARCGI